MPLIYKTKATEAQLQLGHLYTLEKSYFYQHSKCSTDVKELSFEQEKLTTEGGSANYKIKIVDAFTSFKATASAVVDFNGNGVFNLWEINQDKQLKKNTPD